jgi:hypothetical protein
VHEQLVRRELIDGLLENEPHLAADLVLGLQASTFLEDRLADHLVRSWSAGESSLLAPRSLSAA